MSIKDVIKKSVLEGFTQADISTTRVLITLGITLLLAVYILFIYKMQCRSVFYSKEFNITAAATSIVTAAIVLAMQSNIVVSLGMVGALSIVRFRSAIKNPMDLLYLFWSVSVGIVCGAGLFEIAIISSVVITITIFLLDLMPVNKPPYLLIVSSSDLGIENSLNDVVKTYTRYYRMKSRNVTRDKINLIIELRSNKEAELFQACGKIEGIENFSLMSHDGEVRS